METKLISLYNSTPMKNKEISNQTQSTTQKIESNNNNNKRVDLGRIILKDISNRCLKHKFTQQPQLLKISVKYD